MLAGLIAANGGTITLNGGSFQPRGPSDAARAGVVTVHQSTDLIGAPGLTVADALLLNRFADRGTSFFVSRRSVRREAQTEIASAGFPAGCGGAVGRDLRSGMNDGQ